MTRALSLAAISDQDMQEMLQSGAALWPLLRDARVLLTGATGWFGTWLLDTLVCANREYGLGLRVLAMSRDPAAFGARFPALHGAAEVDWLAADLRLPVPTDPGRLSHVIHAATEASALLNREQPDVMFDTTVNGTRHALDLARRGGAGSFLLVSSGAVYGRQPAELAGFPETWSGAPDPTLVANAYAEGKRAAEQLGAIWHKRHALPVKIARCFAFVGPHMPFESHFAIGNFIANAVDQQPIIVRSDGSPRRSWMYMTDLVIALLTILLRGQQMRAYNVGSDVCVTVGDAARRIAQGCGVPCRIEGQPGERDDGYVPDVRRLHDELDLRPSVDFDEAVRRTIAWRVAERDATGRTGRPA